MTLAGSAHRQAGSGAIEALQGILAALQRLNHPVNGCRAFCGNRGLRAFGHRSAAKHFCISDYIPRSSYRDISRRRTHFQDGTVRHHDALAFLNHISHLKGSELSRRQADEGLSNQGGDGAGGGSGGGDCGHGRSDNS